MYEPPKAERPAVATRTARPYAGRRRRASTVEPATGQSPLPPLRHLSGRGVLQLSLLLVLVVVGGGMGVLWLLRTAAVDAGDGHRAVHYVRTLQLTGASGPITIGIDARGYPHVRAASEPDVYQGLGYAVAQPDQRSWQLDLLRQQAECGLAGLLGPGPGNSYSLQDALLCVHDLLRVERDAAGQVRATSGLMVDLMRRLAPNLQANL